MITRTSQQIIGAVFTAVQTGLLVFYFVLQTLFPDLNIFYKCYLVSLDIKEHFKTDFDESGVNKSETCRLNVYEENKSGRNVLEGKFICDHLETDHLKNVYFSKFTYYRI